MNLMVHKNWSEQHSNFRHPWESSSDDIDTLFNGVIAAADSIYKTISLGLPKSVYQLKLINLLSKQGFQLETETSMLHSCVYGEPDRELVIVNGALVIECFAEDEMIDHYHRRIVFDLTNNNHEMGLLINFGADMNNNGITKVIQTSVPH